MKFNEKYEEIQRESDLVKLFKSFQEDVRLLVSRESQSVSFQLAYDHVFKLTKLGKQAEVLQCLDQQLRDLLCDRLVEGISLTQLQLELTMAR